MPHRFPIFSVCAAALAAAALTGGGPAGPGSAAAATAPAPPGASGTATPLTAVAADTPTSAYGGWVVWSEPGQDGRWSLIAWHAGQRVRLPAAPRTVPFDADVGPDARGRPVVTFSRCTTEPDASDPQPWSTARNCSLRVLDLTSLTERALGVRRPAGASDSTPSMWRGRVAFQRRTTGAAVAQLLLFDPATGRARTLPHGAVPHACDFGAACAKATFRGEVGELDLGAATVAFSWRVAVPNVEGVGPGWEMRADRLADGRRVLAGSGYSSGACGGRFPVSPNATADGVWFLNRTYHCDGVEGIVTSTSVGSSLLSVTHAPAGVAWRIARDGATTYAVLGPGHVELSGPLPPGSLQLVRLEGLRPAPTGRPAREPFF